MATAQSRYAGPKGASLSRRILVNVFQGPMLSTPVVIWQHELPILEEIHGEGNIKPVDIEKLDEGYSAKASPVNLPYNKTQEAFSKPSTNLCLGYVFSGDAGIEYQRLADVYGKHREDNVSNVEKVYGRLQSGQFASLVGVPRLADLPEAQLRGLILAYGYAPDVHKEASAEEKREAIEKRKELAAMPLDELVKLAESLDVQLG
ncbi:hypothetical protein RD110_08055 [Rhodoferax koreense]|uniref:Uncharacterized protein n=1 Tax=Rhodoferax koreensis TaxID=1842727 RepID=A0A1P8JTQ9_9BURK|nr:hypothetical protein [Rhodoferax koreense]APW37156.1 hypothetical protein RD110_08055 [Rhodoferax koreense]